MSRMPVRLTLGRVPAMQGRKSKEGIVSSAEALSKMVADGEMIPEQALQAIELIAPMGSTSSLRCAGLALPAENQWLMTWGTFCKRRVWASFTSVCLDYAARQCEITELPLEAVLVGAGILPRPLVRAARNLTERMSQDSLPRDKVILLLQAINERSLSLMQALSEHGIES